MPDRASTGRYGADLAEFSDLTSSTQACFALMLGGDNFSRMVSVTKTGTLIFCALLASSVLLYRVMLEVVDCQYDNTHLPIIIATSKVPISLSKLAKLSCVCSLDRYVRLELGFAWPPNLDEHHSVDPCRRSY
jgi:hypothetical protein